MTIYLFNEPKPEWICQWQEELSEITAALFNCLLICSWVLVIGTICLQKPVRSQTLIDFVLLNQLHRKQSPFHQLFLSLVWLLCDTWGRKWTHLPNQVIRGANSDHEAGSGPCKARWNASVWCNSPEKDLKWDGTTLVRVLNVQRWYLKFILTQPVLKNVVFASIFFSCCWRPARFSWKCRLCLTCVAKENRSYNGQFNFLSKNNSGSQCYDLRRLCYSSSG